MICRYCHEGRHVRCEKADCECQRCASTRTSEPPSCAAVEKARAAIAERNTKSSPKPKPKPKPKELPKSRHRPRKYDPETVFKATAMKLAGRSWTEIADELGVTVGGIRYAVTSYEDHLPEGVFDSVVQVKPPTKHLDAARATIEMLEVAVQSAQQTITQLRAYVDEASSRPDRVG